MITVSELRTRIIDYKNKNGTLPEIFYLSEKEFGEFFELILPDENINIIPTPKQLWFSGIPTVIEGDKRTRIEILEALKEPSFAKIKEMGI